MVLGVSFDSVEQNHAFREKFNFPFLLLCDTDRKIGLLYGACKSSKDDYARRIGYLVDSDGVIEKAFSDVDARLFPEQVLAQL